MGRAFEVRKASMQKTSMAKSKLYSTYSKEIYQAAKNGGTDPASNASLKRLLEKAKKEQVPADVIKRAIDKVNSGIDETYTFVRYEGFGSGSSTIIVDCLTDNINRTLSFVRPAFTKSNSKIGATGSVNHMYDHLCVISFKGLTEEETLNTLIENDLDINDIEDEEGLITIYGQPQDLHRLKNAIVSALPNVEFELDEITMISKDKVKLEGEDQMYFQRLLAMLDEIEDVTNIYHNVEL